MASVQKGSISPPLPTPPPPKKKMGRGRPGKNTAHLHTREGGGEEAFWARGQEKNEEEEEEENSIPLKLSSNRTAHKRGRQGGGERSEKIWEIGTDDSAPRPRGRKRQKKSVWPRGGVSSSPTFLARGFSGNSDSQLPTNSRRKTCR